MRSPHTLTHAQLAAIVADVPDFDPREQRWTIASIE
jgi:hypothetical protein